MPLAQDPHSQRAMGGTELLKFELVRRMNNLDSQLLDHFQIFVSRVHEPINKDKIVIFYLHDLAEDPAAAEELKNGRWNRFDLLVFVSNWQLQQYITRHNIPWSKCIVMENCINPIQESEKDYSGKIRLVYSSTPHRGLQILVPVFEALQKQYPNKLHLDVFSSFALYGWEERDKNYQSLFDMCISNPDITYHGSVPNDTVRSALREAHIFAYPSIWPETSCLCLIEAMSAQLICVHPNYGALADTAGGVTSMYQWREDEKEHAQTFYIAMSGAIDYALIANADNMKASSLFQKVYADYRFNWGQREQQWFALLGNMVLNKDYIIQNRQQESDSSMFRIQTH